MLVIFQLLILAAIAFFDFKDRSIPVLLFIAAFILAGFHLYDQLWQWPLVGINILLASLQIALIATWLRIRKRELSFFKDAFGWGDVLMMWLAAFYFTPMRLIWFILLSSLCSLLFFFIYKRIKNEEQMLIPLAGIMSVLLIIHQLLTYTKLVV